VPPMFALRDPRRQPAGAAGGHLSRLAGGARRRRSPSARGRAAAAWPARG
jgi:hypothetical protein